MAQPGLQKLLHAKAHYYDYSQKWRNSLSRATAPVTGNAETTKTSDVKNDVCFSVSQDDNNESATNTKRKDDPRTEIFLLKRYCSCQGRAGRNLVATILSSYYLSFTEIFDSHKESLCAGFFQRQFLALKEKNHESWRS